jgi:hypothetical protein
MWMGIDRSLRFGRLGLSAGSSMPKFLDVHRDSFKGKSRRPKMIRESERLKIENIVAWRRSHFRCTGTWPNRNSGPVRGLKWSAVDSALKQGNRGLSGGWSLAMMFCKCANRR